MDLFSLVREFGLPVALLIVAVIFLWRAWAIERKAHSNEIKHYRERLETRDDELREIYKDAALQKLRELSGRSKDSKKV